MKEEVIKREKINFSTVRNSKYSKKIAAGSEATQNQTLEAERVRRFIEQRNLTELRKISDTFYQLSGEYRRLVHYIAQLLTFNYLVIPRPSPEQTSEEISEALEMVLNYTKKAAIEETSYSIAFSVVKYGVFFGYETTMENGQITILSLPIEFCRARYKVNGVYQVEFSLKYFDQFRSDEDKQDAFDGFPAEFKKGYSKYLGNNKLEWLELDPQFARAHMLEEPSPLFSSIFLDLLRLDEYEKLDGIKANLDLYTLLIQKIPMTKDNELALYLEEIEDLHNNMRAIVGNTNIDVLTTPCDVEAINIDNNAMSRVERDNIDKATNMIYTSAGTPIALFNSGSHTGNVGLNLSVKVDESLMLPLLKQFERWYNNKLSYIYPSMEFSIIFPEITIFNRSEKVKEYREMAAYGFQTKLLTLTALGIHQQDAMHLLRYENELLGLSDRMIPLKSAHTGSGEGGRPELDETEISDAGITTRNRGDNEE